MIVEERCYRVAPGRAQALLDLFEREGLAIQLEHMGRLVGYFTTDGGALDRVVQIWAFEDHADRERRRQALWADPRWLAYASKGAEMILERENRFLLPTAFSPLR